ncbi:tetratricopeptide repeat protein [Pendulispora brunnea]|uniref:Tetratricopeptide repeat protein n=1 Tax=Pendulispora brunnea TaxID=2905690 RepID=A0ABZ2KBL4_9BACT
MSAKRWFALMLLGCAFSGVVPAGADPQPNPQELFQRSYDAEAVGKLQDALLPMDALPAGARNGYVAQIRRGWLLYKLGRHAEAVDAYSKASALEPRSVESRLGVLAPKIAMRRWSDVESTAREALKLDPNNYSANAKLAFAYYNLGRYAEAATVYKKITDAYPGDIDIRSGLGWSYLKASKAGDAIREFRRILEVAPKHTLAREGLSAAGATE